MSETKPEKAPKTIVDNMIHHAFPPVIKVNSEQCFVYKFRWVDLLLPPYEVLDTLCTSKDKTHMLIYTLVRLLLYGLIGFLMHKYLPRDPVSETIIYLFIALFIVNLIFLGFIVSKKTLDMTPSQETSQETVQETSQEAPQETKAKIKPELVQESKSEIKPEIKEETISESEPETKSEA